MNKLFLLFSVAFLSIINLGCGRFTTHENSVEPTGTAGTRIYMSENLKAGNEMKLTMQINNGSGKDFKFLKWNSPFEQSFLGDYLNIKNEKGEKVEYRGAMAKRMWPPPAESYSTVASGSSVESSIDISQAYPIVSAGKYTIQFEGMSGADSIPASNIYEFNVE